MHCSPAVLQPLIAEFTTAVMRNAPSELLRERIFGVIEADISAGATDPNAWIAACLSNDGSHGSALKIVVMLLCRHGHYAAASGVVEHTGMDYRAMPLVAAEQAPLPAAAIAFLEAARLHYRTAHFDALLPDELARAYELVMGWATENDVKSKPDLTDADVLEICRMERVEPDVVPLLLEKWRAVKPPLRKACRLALRCMERAPESHRWPAPGVPQLFDLALIELGQLGASSVTQDGRRTASYSLPALVLLLAKVGAAFDLNEKLLCVALASWCEQEQRYIGGVRQAPAARFTVSYSVRTGPTLADLAVAMRDLAKQVDALAAWTVADEPDCPLD